MNDKRKLLRKLLRYEKYKINTNSYFYKSLEKILKKIGFFCIKDLSILFSENVNCFDSVNKTFKFSKAWAAWVPFITSKEDSRITTTIEFQEYAKKFGIRGLGKLIENWC